MAGWLAAWLADWMAGWLAAWLAGCLLGWLAGCWLDAWKLGTLFLESHTLDTWNGSADDRKRLYSDGRCIQRARGRIQIYHGESEGERVVGYWDAVGLVDFPKLFGLT